MRAMTFAASAFYGADDVAVPHVQKAGLVARFMEGWRSARADQAGCNAFAELDAAMLKDIGVDQDEIERVHSREMFMPRAWQG